MFSDIQNLYSFFPPINYPYLYTRKTTSYSRLIMAGIYLHIPFCKQRCIYCDFFSTTENDKKSTYVQALSKELELRKDYLDGEIIDTIYFGGGTPSQLEEKDFIQLFETIYKIYTVNPKAEITIEANPDDLTPQYIAMLRTLPFNRLSMGIQTFKEDTLRLLHRRHTAAQAQQAYQHCREVGFQNISIDLMYGLPGEALEDWQKDLQTALQMYPEHISAYHLIYEEGTPLWNLKETHQVEETDEDLSVSLFKELIHTLKSNGYEHYEISNFCRPGFHSRHNSSYWTGKKYLGCGPSAHSYDGTSRQWNVASLSQYIQGIQKGTPYQEKEELDLYTRYNDFIITRLRTAYGIPTHILKETFGETLFDYCMRMASPHLKQGFLTLDNHIMKLTEKGIFISDGIMSDLLWVDD